MVRIPFLLISLLLAACSATPTSIPAPTSAGPAGPVGLWRVRHDVERAEWDFKSRLWPQADLKKLRGLPETVRINGGRGTVELAPAWVAFLDRINTPWRAALSAQAAERLAELRALP